MDKGKVNKEVLSFWNEKDLYQLKKKIVNPEAWDEEIPLHLEYIFGSQDLGSNKTILEIGCGIGRLLKPLAAKGHNLIGLDISTRMLEEAAIYLSGKVNVKTYLLALDGLFPLKDNSIDIIYSIMVFQHIHDRAIIQRYLQESFRVLKDGGTIRVQTHRGIPSVDGKFHGFAGQMYRTLEEFAKEFEWAGLKVALSEEGNGHEHWLWVTAQKC